MVAPSTNWTYTPYLGDFELFGAYNTIDTPIPAVNLPGTLGPRTGVLKHHLQMSCSDSTGNDEAFSLVVQSPFASSIVAYQNSALYNQQALLPLVTITPTNGQMYSQGVYKSSAETLSIDTIATLDPSFAPLVSVFDTNYLVSIVSISLVTPAASVLTFDIIIDFSHTLVN